jgi:hypothetical protein
VRAKCSSAFSLLFSLLSSQFEDLPHVLFVKLGGHKHPPSLSGKDGVSFTKCF